MNRRESDQELQEDYGVDFIQDELDKDTIIYLIEDLENDLVTYQNLQFKYLPSKKEVEWAYSSGIYRNILLEHGCKDRQIVAGRGKSYVELSIVLSDNIGRTQKALKKLKQRLEDSP